MAHTAVSVKGETMITNKLNRQNEHHGNMLHLKVYKPEERMEPLESLDINKQSKGELQQMLQKIRMDPELL